MSAPSGTAGDAPRAPPPARDARSGIAFAVGAFVLWGLFPIYFRAVAAVPALEVLAHRVCWSVVFLAVVVFLGRRWAGVRGALVDRRLLRSLAASAVVIAVNWGVFIWAVAAGRILECSLGYYVTPLISVVLGVAVLGERLRRLQWLAVALAATAVAIRIVGYGAVPWVALLLAVSFSAYGLLRKTTPVDPLDGLFVEALLLSPPAAAFLVWRAVDGSGAFGAGDATLDLLLVLAGPVTALPLILFVAGARRIRLATLGLLQYITPTGQFLLAVGAFGERLTTVSALTFACIWTALALYSADAVRGNPWTRGHGERRSRGG